MQSQMYLGTLNFPAEDKNNDRGGPAPPPKPPPPPSVPPLPSVPPPPTVLRTISSSPLSKKYKYEGGYYHSITTGSMFENMISCVPGGGCFKAFEIWQTEQFYNVREIDHNIRKEYRKQSGGHGGYTFHHLSIDEMYTFCRCLENAI